MVLPSLTLHRFSRASPVQIGISNKKSAIPIGMTDNNIRWLPSAAVCCFPSCGARCAPCRRCGCVAHRPRRTKLSCCICRWQRRPAWAKFSLASPVQIGISNKKSAIPVGLTNNIRWLPAAALCCFSFCGARCAPCRRSGCVAHRPRQLAQVASSATGGAPIAPQIFTGFASSNRYQQ